MEPAKPLARDAHRPYGSDALAPPEEGTPVEIRLADGRRIPTVVVDRLGHLVWLALPPVLHVGAAIDICWIGCAARGTVLRSGLRGELALGLGPVRVDRRFTESWVPTRRVTVLARSGRGPGACRLLGVVRDLSVAGVSFWTSDHHRGPARVSLTLSLGDGGGTVVDGATADVVGVERRDDRQVVLCRFESVGTVAIALASLRASDQPFDVLAVLAW